MKNMPNFDDNKATTDSSISGLSQASSSSHTSSQPHAQPLLSEEERSDCAVMMMESEDGESEETSPSDMMWGWWNTISWDGKKLGKKEATKSLGETPEKKDNLFSVGWSAEPNPESNTDSLTPTISTEPGKATESSSDSEDFGPNYENLPILERPSPKTRVEPKSPAPLKKGHRLLKYDIRVPKPWKATNESSAAVSALGANLIQSDKRLQGEGPVSPSPAGVIGIHRGDRCDSHPNHLQEVDRALPEVDRAQTRMRTQRLIAPFLRLIALRLARTS
eukprot:g44067.t1